MVTHNTPETVNPAVPSATNRGFVVEESTAPRAISPMRSFVSWGAIIAGSLLAISIIALSSSLGYACGVSAFTGGQYGWGAGIWAVITAGIAFFCGGCLASYLAPVADNYYQKMLHGVMTWGLSVPLMLFFFAGTFGSLVAHTGVVLTGGTPSALFPSTGAAWGVFISLVVGLIFAAAGGSAGTRQQREL